MRKMLGVILKKGKNCQVTANEFSDWDSGAMKRMTTGLQIAFGCHFLANWR
jgi:hypothetical protein